MRPVFRKNLEIGGDPHIQYFNRHGYVLRPAEWQTHESITGPAPLCLRVGRAGRGGRSPRGCDHWASIDRSEALSGIRAHYQRLSSKVRMASADHQLAGARDRHDHWTMRTEDATDCCD